MTHIRLLPVHLDIKQYALHTIVSTPNTPSEWTMLIEKTGIKQYKVYQIPVHNSQGIFQNKFLMVKEGTQLYDKIVINGNVPNRIIQL